MPDPMKPFRLVVSAARVVWRPLRPLRPRLPWTTRPPRGSDDKDLQPPEVRRKVRVQVQVIRRAYGDEVQVHSETGDDGDAEYFFRRATVLLRDEDVPRLDGFFEERPNTYRGAGEVVERPVEGLSRYRLPARADTEGNEPDVRRTLDEVDRALGEGLATPDHLLFVLPRGLGSVCPAVEPEEPCDTTARPTLTSVSDAGKGVRVSVVDTGWHPPAATHPATPWLSGVTGDVETIDPNAIHPYGGHGTFVAGVVRCAAPATEVNVEGFLLKGGAVWESEICRQLNEAMTAKERPQLVSISAGGRTRKSIGMLAFTVVSELLDLVEGEDAPLVVAAAGNDGSTASQLELPAADPFVVAVGALDTNGTIDTSDDAIADFSSRSTRRGPDVVAPGTGIVSLRVPGSELDRDFAAARVGDRWFRGGGTSQATAVVSGLAALLLSARSDLTPDQVKALLENGARSVSGASVAAAGSGRVDVARAFWLPTPGPAAVQRFTPAILDLSGAGDAQADPGTAQWAGRRWSGRRWSSALWSGRRWSGAAWVADGN